MLTHNIDTNTHTLYCIISKRVACYTHERSLSHIQLRQSFSLLFLVSSHKQNKISPQIKSYDDNSISEKIRSHSKQDKKKSFHFPSNIQQDIKK